MSTKKCIGKHCGMYKEESEFFAVKANEDGLHKYCKHCCKVNRAIENVRKRDKKSGISNRQVQRARQLGIEYDATVTLVKVFRQSLGICGICTLWVQPRHASMDHVTPVSRGGVHRMHNLQISHLKCNMRKGNRT